MTTGKIIHVDRQPTREELAEQRQAEYRAAVEARDAALDAALLASEPFRQFLRGDLTLSNYRTEAAKIAADFPMPEEPA